MNWTLAPIAQLEGLARHWDALALRLGGLPFLESHFLLPLLREFGRGDEWLAFATEGSGPDAPWCAALILQRSGRLGWSSFQPSQLPTGPVLLPRHTRLPQDLDGLLRRLPGPALLLGLTQLDEALLPVPPQDRPRLASQPYIQTAWVEVAGSFEDYWEARGKNLRQNTRKQLKKVEAAGMQPRLDCLREPAQMAEAVQQYGQLESSGWKAGEGTAIAADNAQGRFYLAMLENFARQGRARVYRYRFNDAVVAMDLCIEQAGQLIILKTAYDQAHNAVSPATLMRQEQFQQLFAEGSIRRIEFYGRVMEWHTRWTEQQRGLYHLNLYRLDLLRRLHQRGQTQAAAAAAPAASASAPAEPAA